VLSIYHYPKEGAIQVCFASSDVGLNTRLKLEHLEPVLVMGLYMHKLFRHCCSKSGVTGNIGEEEEKVIWLAQAVSPHF